MSSTSLAIDPHSATIEDRAGIGYYWRRLALGVLLSIVLGHELMGYGIGLLLNPVALLGLVALYTFIFAVADDLIARFDLTDRDLAVLAIPMALVLGGIVDQEVYDPDIAAQLPVYGDLNILAVVLVPLMWGVYLVSAMHVLRLLVPRHGRSSQMTWRGWLANGFLLVLILGTYFDGHARSDRAVTDAFLLVLAVCSAAALAFGVRRRRADQRELIRRRAVTRSSVIVWLTGAFVAVSVVVVAVWGAQPIPLNLLLMVLYIPIIFGVMARQRVAI